MGDRRLRPGRLLDDEAGEGPHSRASIDPNPKAVNRVYPASATRVAWAMAEVMSKDPILDDVKVMVDPQSNESRPLSHGRAREAGDLPAQARLARRELQHHGQVARTATASASSSTSRASPTPRSACSTASAGDPELSREILDEVEAALAGPAEGPGIGEGGRPPRPPRRRPTTR